MDKPMNLEEVLQDLYDSEINVAIFWLWDGGIDLGLGDELKGYDADGQVRTVAEATAWLRDQACKHYPDSGFARKYYGFPRGDSPAHKTTILLAQISRRIQCARDGLEKIDPMPPSLDPGALTPSATCPTAIKSP